MDVHEHGIWVDQKRQRVKCNYCGKEMQSFQRLRYHLGAVGTYVTHCGQVSLTVRETFRKMFTEEKSVYTSPKKVEKFLMGKRLRSEYSTSKSVSPESENVDVQASKQDLMSNKAQKCIGRFFFENCVDFLAVDSPSFKEMIMTVGGGQMGFKIPDSHDLSGWMLKETLKEVQDHVKKIKESWAITGCSILLDAWVDQKGHDLVSFVADCPEGAVYLNSFNVSDIKTDVNALSALVNEVVKEVEAHQVIACSTFGWVGELGKLYADHDKEVFWSVSLSHCFEIMLEKIVTMHSYGDVLDKVNNVWAFINNNPLVFKIFKDHSNGTT